MATEKLAPRKPPAAARGKQHATGLAHDPGRDAGDEELAGKKDEPEVSTKGKGKKEAKEPLNEYEILEPGTIIDDVHYPNSAAKKGEEWIVKLTHSEAQNHQMNGLRLRRRAEE